MRLSIIIPVYNTERYLHQCLDSCINQNLQFSDYEIICIDDGSTDDSSQIIDQYAKKYSNVIAVHQVNSGVSASRNLGMRLAHGEYVWFVDADDILMPDSFEKILPLMNCQNDRIRLGVYMFFEPCSDDFRHAILKSNFPLINLYVWSSVFKKKSLQEHSISFQENIYYGEDALFDYEFRRQNLMEVTESSVCYLYRRHPDSAMQMTTPERNKKRISSHVSLLMYMQENYYDRRDSEYAKFVASDIEDTLSSILQSEKAQQKEYIQALSAIKSCSLFNRFGLYMKIIVCLVALSKVQFLHPFIRWILALLKRIQVIIKSGRKSNIKTSKKARNDSSTSKIK